MTLKPCPCCKKKLTTKKVYKVGRQELGSTSLLLVNCKDCHSTLAAGVIRERH